MMDFALAERQQAVADLAAQVLAGVEGSEGADPWKELAQAGLLDVSPPDGLGVLDAAVLLTEIGRRAPSRQALATLMTGALPVARWGSRDQQRALLPGIASGELLLTAAIREPSHPAPVPPATAVTNGKITGTKVGVPHAAEALVRGAGTQDRSDMSSLARRAGDGCPLSLAPVLLPGRRPGPVPRRRGLPAGPMFIDLTPDQRALRDQLRGYFAGLLSPAERAALLTERHGDVYRDVVRRMGRDGWLGVGWPARYGGRGFGQVEQQIFADEAARADVPLPAVTLQTVGPTLQEYGTPWQQEFFLPKILAGEVHFAIGYTEPEAGTDLAALRTRAVRDGEEYVIDGQKIFTTGAHEAGYVWLACRTAPARHKGISILIVDTGDPGFSWTPIITHDGAHHVNATYYSGVRVPVRMRVGAENEGWRLITTQLNHERVMLGPAGRIAVLHDRVRAWAAKRNLLSQPDVRRALARASAVMRVNELLNWHVASSGGLAGVVPRGASRAAPALDVADASATKVFSSEQLQLLGQELAEVVGRHADAEPDTAALMTWLDVQLKRNIVLTFGGGVNEIQRELIATAGLGLPRAPR